MDGIEIGMEGHAEMIVGTNDTAPRVGSGRIAVLATPVMINLVEEAALDAIEERLPAGCQSLGTHLDVSHIAATPTGHRVVALARVTEIDGRRVTFDVSVRDELETVGEGHHTRVVVTADTFTARVSAKAKRSQETSA